MSAELPTTKRERRLAAREDRKRRAVRAQKQAQLRRMVLVAALALMLVAAIVWTFSTSFFGLAAPSIGRAMPIEKADHVPEGTPLTYGTRPPTSGMHFASIQPSYGVFTNEITPGLWVHNLEHGAVVLLYNCPEGCPDLVQQIRELHANLPKGRNARGGVARMLAVPYTDMDSRIAVVAWGYLLELNEFDRDQITRFYEARIDRGPECQNFVCPQ